HRCRTRVWGRARVTPRVRHGDRRRAAATRADRLRDDRGDRDRGAPGCGTAPAVRRARYRACAGARLADPAVARRPAHHVDRGAARAMTRYLVTGGAGFIGFNFVRELLANEPDCEVVVLDKLTYAANPRSLAELAG